MGTPKEVTITLTVEQYEALKADLKTEVSSETKWVMDRLTESFTVSGFYYSASKLFGEPTKPQ